MGKMGGANPFFYKKIYFVPQNDQFPRMDRAKNNKESGGPCPLMNHSKKTELFISNGVKMATKGKKWVSTLACHSDEMVNASHMRP